MDYKDKVIALLNSQELSKEQKEKLEDIFPELKESEGERIRKALAAYFAKFKPNDMWDADFSFGDIVAWLEKQGDKSAWSEEDESMLNFVKVVLNKHKDDAFFDKFKTTLNDCLTWFRNIKSRVGCEVNCITTKEWSEEDEVKINRIVSCLENLNVADNDILLKDVDWLKSLRPCSQWKPSDEQMKLLREVQQALLGKDCHNRFVNFMYELKRLREE